MTDNSGIIEKTAGPIDSLSTHPSDEDARISSAIKPPEILSVAASQVPPPPDGGLKAWIQVLGAHFLFFNSW